MIELDDSLPEQPANTHFFADEARSGFDADMESFGAFANTKLPPPLTNFTPTNTVQSEHSTEKTAAQETVKQKEHHEEHSIRLSEEEMRAAEALVAHTTADTSNSLTAFDIPLINEEAIANEASKQEASQPSVAAEEPKPLSEAQRLADLLTADLFAPQQVQNVSAANVSSPNEFTTGASVAGASTFGVEAPLINELGNDATASNIAGTILSIPSETEIAREQQRQLRKQELLNYQHRKKEQQKAAEQFGDRANTSGRTIAAIVISLFLGAVSLAGFFAWRSPALRTAAQEAWSKLTGKPVPPMNTEVTLNTEVTQEMSSQTFSHASDQTQTKPNTASIQGDSGIVPLDLTQSGSAGMTVAAQDSLIAEKNLTNNAASNSSSDISNTAVNGASPNNSAITSTAQNTAQNPSPANASPTKENSPKASQTLAAREQSSLASSTMGSNGTQGAAPKNPSTAKNDGKTLTQNAAAPEKTSSAKPMVVKENPPKTASQNAYQNTVATKANAEKSSSDKSGAAKASTLSKTSLEKPTPPYTSNGVFAIQVYASPSQADAEDWVERLRRRGFVNPTMSSQLVRGQLLYRVRFGLYNNLRQAEQDAERYGFAGAWVVRLR